MKKMTVLTSLILCAAMLAGCGSTKEESDVAGMTVSEAVTAEDTADAGAAGTETAEEQDAADGEETADASASADDLQTENADDVFGYADMTGLQFEFCSGVGGWSTDLVINEDGSFTGEYHDSDMGDMGDDYPNGTYYYCSFAGKFADLTKVDELTYSTTITELNYDNEVDTTEIIDGMKYVYSVAYGLDDAGTIYFYLPGSRTADLPEEYVGWVNTALYDPATGSTSDTLTFTGLYNENAGDGFSSYEITGSADTYDASQDASYGLTADGYMYSESYDETLENKVLNAATQTDMNMAATERYNYWDGILNDEWSALETLLSTDEMDSLRTEQLKWITSRDQAMADAGAEYEGGSIQSMVQAEAGAEATKARCAELKAIIDEHI